MILAEVGKALSQITHYLENQKKSGISLHGIVIIGRRKDLKDYFIDQFNQYLHGIEIVTFDELYDKAKNTIDAFKNNLQ